MMILNFENKIPVKGEKVFIADGAFLIGDIVLEDHSSVWFNSVLRGDMEKIRIGKKTNIQDCSVLHCDPGVPLIIGDNVTIGHRSVIHGCTIENNVLIGMGSIIMNRAKIGTGSIVAAGSTILEGTEIPPYCLVAGSPGKIKKRFNEDILTAIESSAIHYAQLKDRYLEPKKD